MLRQAAVRDLISGKVQRGRRNYVVITMRRYPRFVRRELRDEYVGEMAPDPELFADWLSVKRGTGSHELAFVRSRYERRFSLTSAAFEHLARLSLLSRRRDVFLVCQCEVGQRCHREILLLVAKRKFRARVERVFNSYPIFMDRMEQDRILRASRRPPRTAEAAGL